MSVTPNSPCVLNVFNNYACANDYTTILECVPSSVGSTDGTYQYHGSCGRTRGCAISLLQNGLTSPDCLTLATAPREPPPPSLHNNRRNNNMDGGVQLGYVGASCTPGTYTCNLEGTTVLVCKYDGTYTEQLGMCASGCSIQCGQPYCDVGPGFVASCDGGGYMTSGSWASVSSTCEDKTEAVETCTDKTTTEICTDKSTTSEECTDKTTTEEVCTDKTTTKEVCTTKTSRTTCAAKTTSTSTTCTDKTSSTTPMIYTDETSTTTYKTTTPMIYTDETSTTTHKTTTPVIYTDETTTTEEECETETETETETESESESESESETETESESESESETETETETESETDILPPTTLTSTTTTSSNNSVVIIPIPIPIIIPIHDKNVTTNATTTLPGYYDSHAKRGLGGPSWVVVLVAVTLHLAMDLVPAHVGA
ncbi:hypothetical protein BJ741DRAFT_590280 [Chytriomyces cf. hyalinus JEL632]|nr:hypothetical protein BJ741DRAFT_590280 [Chytriomyces cf. hyalinus JEL632]